MQVVDAEENFGRQGGQARLIASLEERYVSKSGTTNHSASGNGRGEWSLESHPTFDHIIHSPTKDDYPLWRLRCKVTLVVSVISHT